MDIDKITKNVKIDGHMFEIEYLKFEHSDWLETKWTLWDKITIPFYRFRGHCRELRNIIKWAFQRMFRGYDDWETWELHHNFVTRYKKILSQFRKEHHGYPSDLTEEQWDGIIDRMIHCLDMMDEDYVGELLDAYKPEDCITSPKSIYDIMTEYKNEFFQMFSEWFYNLWD